MGIYRVEKDGQTIGISVRISGHPLMIASVRYSIYISGSTGAVVATTAPVTLCGRMKMIARLFSAHHVFTEQKRRILRG